MKKALIAVMLLSVALVAGVFAEDNAEGPKQGVVNQPPEGKSIFTFKKDLELTDVQEDKLKAILYDYQNSIATYGPKLNTLRSQLTTLTSTKGDLKLIRKVLEGLANVQVEVSYLDISTSRRMGDVLTPEQQKKWQDIKKRELAQAQAQ